MSEALSKSFNNLTVMRSRLCWLIFQTDIFKKVTAPPRIQVALPNLSTDGRACYYGYDVAIEWLAEYGAANWIWTPVENSHPDDLSMASGGMTLLRSHSGISRLKFRSGLKDHTVPSDAVTIPGYRTGEVQVPLIDRKSVV